tara:strand:+ start:78 stop:695 length:618 start_codon:yes stop_codon:yes gene_type:complete
MRELSQLVKGLDLIESNEFERSLDLFKKLIRDKKNIIFISCLFCGLISNIKKEYINSEIYLDRCLNIFNTSKYQNKHLKKFILNELANIKYKINDYKAYIDIINLSNKIKLSKDELKSNNLYISLELNDIISSKENLTKKINNVLSIILKENKNNYDLINDYKKLISTDKKESIIKELIYKSNNKLNIGDFKAAAKHLRRSEKYK